MTYTVVWKRSAERELAEIWLQAVNHDAVGHSADQIDRQLRLAPLDAGESRDEDYRILCILPLVVGYRVSEDDRVVTVVRIRVL